MLGTSFMNSNSSFFKVDKFLRASSKSFYMIGIFFSSSSFVLTSDRIVKTPTTTVIAVKKVSRAAPLLKKSLNLILEGGFFTNFDKWGSYCKSSTDILFFLATFSM